MSGACTTSLTQALRRTAICRGAVFKGFLDGLAATRDEESRPQISSSIVVTSTIARASYGISFDDIFDNSVHREEDKFYDEDEGIWRARSQMKWYLKKVCLPSFLSAWTITWGE